MYLAFLLRGGERSRCIAYKLLISNRQYGFVKGRSTALQLLQVLDKWIDCLENGGQIYAVYTDFEKSV